jgi:hypothetical protein
VTAKALSGQLIVVTDATDFHCPMLCHPQPIEVNHAACAQEFCGEGLPLGHWPHDHQVLK